MCKAKDELSRIEKQDALIDSKLEELVRLDALAKKMTSALNGDVASGSRDPAKLQKVWDKLIDAGKEIDRQIDDYVDMKRYYSGLIDKLEKGTHIKLLYGVYFHGKTLEDMAKELKYSYRNVCYIHGAALQAMDNLIEKYGVFESLQ